MSNSVNTEKNTAQENLSNNIVTPGILMFSTVLYLFALASLGITVILFEAYTTNQQYLYLLGILVFIFFGLSSFSNRLKSYKLSVVLPICALLYIAALIALLFNRSIIDPGFIMIFYIFAIWTTIPIIIHILLLLFNSEIKNYY
jgi:hypothetical protein